jgi:hypothetical protein
VIRGLRQAQATNHAVRISLLVSLFLLNSLIEISLELPSRKRITVTQGSGPTGAPFALFCLELSVAAQAGNPPR